jgi:DNA polymerase III sliding clamp (beta) subunit (PCNA family)
MNFKKDQLEFLSVFSLVSDTKLKSTDKVKIKKEDDSIVFSLTSSSMTIIQKIASEGVEDIDTVFPVVQLNQLVQQSPLKADLIFENEGIRISDSSIYKFVQDDSIHLTNATDYFSMLKEERATDIVIKDLLKISLLKNYISSLEGFDAVLVSNGYFIASNKTDYVGAVQTANEKDIVFYLPKALVTLLSTLKVSEVTICNYEDFMYLTVNGFHIFIPTKNFVLPNIFSEDWLPMITHDNSITFNKKSFLEGLGRISIMTQSNLFNRVFLTFTEAEVIIENKDKGYSVEKIKHTKIDPQLVGCYVAVSSQYMNLILNSLEGEDVSVFATNDPEAATLKVVDPKNNNFYVHVLYETTDFSAESV